MKIRSRWLLWLIALLGASVAPLRAATPQLFVATKVTGYTQTTAAGDFIPFESILAVEMRFMSSVVGTTATLTGPSGNRTLVADGTTDMAFNATYPTGAALENAFPVGAYSIVLSGASTGTFPFTFPVNGPAPVRITNYSALQSINGTSVTVTWEALPLSLSESAVVTLEIYSADDQLVWSSSGLGVTSQSALVTGLPANGSFYGYLSYVGVPITFSGGIPCSISRGTLVRFALSTRTSPVFTVHPLSQAINGRATVSLSAAVSDASGVTYQWNKDGLPIPGATTLAYVATGPGFYTVTATNSSGATTSNAAILNPTPPLGDARLFAISCRARVGTGGDILIPGIVIAGSGQRQVIVRAKGPSIVGVSGTLARPQLKLYKAGVSTPVAENIGWSSGTQAQTDALKAAFSQVGLSDFLMGSADCALLTTMDAGAAYTATISGVGETTGVALVEVYELGASSARMSALSCRAQVGTGGDVLIPGIAIAGSSPKQVLIRAKGPGIVGVGGLLARPTLAVYSGGGVKLSENTGWSTSPDAAAIATATTAVGLVPFTVGSGDCAVLVTLPPGGYTAQVSGVDGTTGVALIEVYEVP